MRKRERFREEDFKIHDDLEVYSKDFDKHKFPNKSRGLLGKIGIKIAYLFILLIELLKSRKIPFKIKVTIIGSLIYFVSPIDIIPDFLPGIGITDDIGVIAMAIIFALGHADDTIRQRAKMKVDNLFN